MANTCSGDGEEPTRSVILTDDGRVFHVPTSWTTAAASQQLRRRFNLVGGGFNIGICVVMTSDNIQIGGIRRGQLYFRLYRRLTCSHGETRDLLVYLDYSCHYRYSQMLLRVGESRLDELIPKGVDVLVCQRQRLRKRGLYQELYIILI